MSEEFQHSAGPWELVDGWIESDDGPVCMINANLLLSGRELADARLIAAAPDLLECAETMLIEYKEGRSPGYDIREMCRAALAKVRGQVYS